MRHDIRLVCILGLVPENPPTASKGDQSPVRRPSEMTSALLSERELNGEQLPSLEPFKDVGVGVRKCLGMAPLCHHSTNQPEPCTIGLQLDRGLLALARALVALGSTVVLAGDHLLSSSTPLRRRQ